MDERRAAASGYGAELYRLVEEYAGLGDHRTGTAVDAATIAWFDGELTRRGARVERHPFTFERYVADWSITVDGDPVAACPLYYEAVGTVSSRSPFVAEAAVLAGHRTAPSLARVLDDARAVGSSLAVVATANPAGLLQVPNRAPLPGDGPPTLLVPGALSPRLPWAAISASLSAHLEPGRSENVVGHFGASAAAPVVIGTPLSGWFGCAGERGTGIAIALSVAERLATSHHVVVVGTSGHELLPHVGLASYLSAGAPASRCVVHLGANLAVREPRPDSPSDPARPLLVNARVEPSWAGPLGELLAPAGAMPRLDPDDWHGEARLWAAAGDYPLLSMVGGSALFHTPEDLPAAATSPATLARVSDAVAGAVAWLASRAAG
ncbi:MAG TPA: hypothetical protein VFN57_10430 [Thermomicrobiaceae bacterium]|nr:hypothetical protein [Thermomicrobiaceae bacterium]